MASPRPKAIKNQNSKELLGLAGIYALLFIGLSLKSPFFLKWNNLINILTDVSVIGIIAIVMTMVIVSGGLDLSVGSVVAVTGVMVAQLSHVMPIGAAVVCALLVGIVIGTFNGFAITQIGINPFITTLATLSIGRGLAYFFSKGETQTIDSDLFSYLGNGRVGPIPVQVILLVVLALFAAWVMKSTVFGRSVYAIGGNAQASRLAGLPVQRLQMAVYILSGFSAALGGMVLASQLSAAAPESSNGMELRVIAAVILGGTSLTGGKGTIAGTMLGVMILGTLNNGLNLLGVPSSFKEIALGAVLLAAVALDMLRLRYGQK